MLFVSTAFLEKQHIQDFVPATSARVVTDSPYFKAMNETAKRLDFTSAGDFVQNRSSPVYQACVSLWVSQDSQTLLRIAGGKTAGIPIRRSSLISFLEQGRIIETSDEFGMADLSDLTDRKVILNGGLNELVAGHQQRLVEQIGPKRTFSEAQAMIACEAMQAMKAARMERLGLSKFVNAERTVWRYTLKGAWISYSKGLRKQLAEGKMQMERVKLKRPGDK